MRNDVIRYRDAYNQSPKLCEQCGAPMLVLPHQKVSGVKKKRFCSPECRIKSMQAAQRTYEEAPRLCPICKTPILRHGHESYSATAKRVYCSRRCQGLGRRAEHQRPAQAIYNANPIHCQYCSQPILCPDHRMPRDVKRQKFCSVSCARLARSPRHAYNAAPHHCKHCGGPILCRPGDQLPRVKTRLYCSRRCAQLDIKGPGILRRRDTITKGALGKKTPRYREDARHQCADRPQICAICGWSIFVQICHIRAINDFPDNATLAEINAQDNLVLLCPNHHWMLDHGLLRLQSSAAPGS